MANKLCNQDILEQLRNGTAKFELVSSPLPSLAAAAAPKFSNITSLFGIGNCSTSTLFFARISSSLGGQSPAMKKLEQFSVQKVTGDGRCMFRALVKGMAYNKGVSLNQRKETEDADELRRAVKEVLCDNNGERKLYKEALIAITVAESLPRYCQRIARSDFWGGESELLVLAKLCKQPIIVYIPEHEYTGSGWGSGFIAIAEYGSEFKNGTTNRTPKKPVRLLFSGKNHYDLLL
ncbi:OVARIAN TUMOR DOMAIN-containing deubiquitinating enzyme 3 isoform X1 [Arachis stenosperma]|uniref:OVARIAN TUMOR DOMAIN-containing deubiquitinating enzyme 3 isoform X1 n=1 Tax=Arachis stenosperma TaxID=217475 RepID=UPI0025AD143D|nr:OVARIAN TUMOR DOMAIN-containing deubiquitinating enzyme 3 isoform X1 [Arachis stenosperma]